MIIIYDSKKPAHERVTIDRETGFGPEVCGAYDLKVETTDIERERALAEFKVTGWGDSKNRAGRHQAVAQAVKKAKAEVAAGLKVVVNDRGQFLACIDKAGETFDWVNKVGDASRFSPFLALKFAQEYEGKVHELRDYEPHGARR